MLRTPRIELRPMTLDHLPHLIELDADPQVLRHILGRARTEAEAIDFWGPICLDAYADAMGLGWWVGFATHHDAGAEQGEFLGWWSLAPARHDVPVADASGVPQPQGDRASLRAEAGWRLRAAHWRRGLASEGARALVTHGFDTAGLDLIWAETMAVNAASRGVMRSLGMRHVRTEHRRYDDPLPGNQHGDVIYELTRTRWRDDGAALAGSGP